MAPFFGSKTLSCAVIPSETVDRSGVPSSAKKSMVSRKVSIIPSKAKVPHSNFTCGGTWSCRPISAAIFAVWVQTLVNFPLPSGADVVSNTSSIVSLVVLSWIFCGCLPFLLSLSLLVTVCCIDAGLKWTSKWLGVLHPVNLAGGVWPFSLSL